MKKCNKCNKIKDDTDFYTQRRTTKKVLFITVYVIYAFLVIRDNLIKEEKIMDGNTKRQNNT